MLKHFALACGLTLLTAGAGMAEDPPAGFADNGSPEVYGGEQRGNSGTERGSGDMGDTGSGATGRGEMPPPDVGQPETTDNDGHHGLQDRDDGHEGGDAGAEDPGNQHLGTP